MEDIIVVGAGIIGASAAYRLTQAGLRPLVIDAAAPAHGCSFGNAGLIAVDHVAPLASPETMRGVARMLLDPSGPLRLHARALLSMAPWMLRFALAARPNTFARNTAALASLVTHAGDAWQRLVDARIVADLYRDIGALYVYEKPVEASAQRKQCALYEKYGVQYQDLTPSQVRERYLPALTPNVSHARYFPAMASVADPLRVAERIFDAARAAGAVFMQAEVTALHAMADGSIRVQMGADERRARKVVLCAGARTASLARMLGRKIPLTAERGYHVALAAPRPDTLHVPVSFVERGFTCNPLAAGIRLAGTVELGARGGPDFSRADILATHFARLFPGAQAPQVESRWYGDRPTLPDYLPMIGALPGLPSVVVATGHQHLGLTLGPLTGELVAALISGAPPGVDLAPFGVGRF